MTKLIFDQNRRLKELEAATGQLAAAERVWRDAVYAALDAGVPKAVLAEAAGIDRSTLYRRWLADREGGE